ncbi:MAG: hypothetical protein FJ267_09425, partial [Planctomycetes bacterium]|nr:hypothetical protein [Planctomycetota bacterium]
MKYALVVLFFVMAAPVHAASITLIRDGKSTAAIHVSPDYMANQTTDANSSRLEIERAAGKARVRESVKDLAEYLRKMTGATVPIHTRPPSSDDETIPLLV